MKCKNCGSELNEGDVFCGVCGQKVELVQSDSPAPEKNEKKLSPKLMIILAILVILIVLAIVVLVLVFGKDKMAPTSTDTASTAQQTTAQTTQIQEPTTPLLDMDDKLKSIIKNSKAKETEFAIAAVDGEIQTYGETKAKTASALVIYPILYRYAQLIDNGELSAEEKIEIQNAQNGRGILSTEEEGKKYSVEDLFRIAFQHSDNTAINSLLTHLGLKDIDSICKKDGFKSVRVEKYVGIDGAEGADNTINAGDLARMIQKMIRKKGFGERIMSQYSKLGKKNTMGMADYLSGSYETFNGYTNYIYNEALHFKGEQGEYIAVFISSSDTKDDGVATAEELGQYIGKCLE